MNGIPARGMRWRAVLRRRAPAWAAVLIALALCATPAWAQLVDEATVSTKGTQFVKPEPPPAPAPAAPTPAAPPAPAPAAVQTPKAAPPAPEPPRYPSVVILLDTSDSMLNTLPGTRRTRLAEAKGALIHMLSGMSPEARVQLWTFDTHMTPVLLKGMRPGQFVQIGAGGNRQALIAKVQEMKTAGGTNLYQSVVKALGFFGAPGDQAAYRSGLRFPSLVIVSDGEDSGRTREKLSTVQAAKRKYPLVTVSTIGFTVSAQEPWFEVLCTIATRHANCATANDEAQLGRILDSFHRAPGAQ